MLDECDEMLNMGFVDDVEKILGANKDKAAVQTLLFSATLPSWVKDITRRFLKPTFKTIDLVGNERMKARHACLLPVFTKEICMLPYMAGVVGWIPPTQ